MFSSQRTISFLMLTALLSAGLAGTAQSPRTLSREEVRMIDHEDPSWNSVRAHLPDPTIATAAQLETAADILRARRFIADALDYYEFSLRRGGNPIDLLNKMGVSSLELRNLAAARAYFQQVVKLQKKSPEGWNNLGAIEYLTGHYDNAINNYKKAIKYDKASATYHSNLGTAYFEKKDFEAARKQYDTALKIDPDLMQHHSSIGVTARMLSPADHARFCYEMARLYARRGNEDAMIHFLTMASEAGFDVMGQLPFDDSLARYRKDPRVLLLVKNAHDLRTRGIPIASGAAPPLPAEAPTKN